MLKAVVELAAYGVAATLAAVCFLVWAWKWGGWMQSNTSSFRLILVLLMGQ